jgi:hypothetical protein
MSVFDAVAYAIVAFLGGLWLGFRWGHKWGWPEGYDRAVLDIRHSREIKHSEDGPENVLH